MKKLIHSLIFISNQLWIFHVQTRTYAEHIALGEAYGLIDDFKDSITERLFADSTGKRPDLSGNLQLAFGNFDDPNDALSLLDNTIEMLQTEDACTDTADIRNQTEELIFKLKHIIYKLSLTTT